MNDYVGNIRIYGKCDVCEGEGCPQCNWKGSTREITGEFGETVEEESVKVKDDG